MSSDTTFRDTMHRTVIIISYLISGALIIGLNFEDMFSGELIAGLGSFAVLSFFSSPFTLYYSIRDLKHSGMSRTSMMYAMLSLVYFFSVSILAYRLWPQIISL